MPFRPPFTPKGPATVNPTLGMSVPKKVEFSVADPFGVVGALKGTTLFSKPRGLVFNRVLTFALGRPY